MKHALPPLVAAAIRNCESAGLPHCHHAVGQMLAVLTAHLRPRARVLELGTSAGVGTAWIASGLLPRTDVSITTVEHDRRIAQIAAGTGFPSFVDIRLGDSLALLPQLGMFDLIFADTARGKWESLDLTIAALQPAGMLIVDDMNPIPGMKSDRRNSLSQVRTMLMNSDLLLSTEARLGTGIILSTRRSLNGAWDGG